MYVSGKGVHLNAVSDNAVPRTVVWTPEGIYCIVQRLLQRGRGIEKIQEGLL